MAVNGSPEEDVFICPILGDEMRVGKQIVEHIGVEDRLAREFLTKLVALNAVATLLLVREIKRNLGCVPIERTALLVFLHLPTIWDKRVGVEINDVFDGEDAGVSGENFAKLEENIALAYPLDFVGTESAPLKCPHQIVGEITIEPQIAHGCSSLVKTVSVWLPGFSSGLF
jgi:hypothetical protein